MYQKVSASQRSLIAIGAAAALAVALGANAASADTAKCIQTISKATAKYEVTVQKASGKCQDAHAKDPSKTPSCPDSKASAKIAGALTKLQDSINKDCATETVASLGFSGQAHRCNGGVRDTLACVKNSDCNGECGSGGQIGEPCTSNGNCAAQCSIQGVGAEEPAGSGIPFSCKGGGATACANLRHCSTTTTQQCGVDGDCPGGETCVGKCSVTTSTQCHNSGECPGGESCVGVGVCNDPGFAGMCNNPAGGTCDPADRCVGVIDDSAPFADCDAPLATVSDITDCLVCNENAIASVATGFAYGARRAPFGDPGFGLPDNGDDGKSVLDCQRSLGKAVSKYFQKIRKATQKCTAGVLKEGSGSCPDSKLTDAISKAAQKLSDTVDKKCGGSAYAETLNGDQVLALQPSASTLDLPNSAANFKTSSKNLLDKLITCSDGFSAPSLLGGCASNCGDGQVDVGEDCDDGNVLNGDTCPSDCKLNTACSVTGTANVDFNVTAPAGITLGALKAYLAYDNTKVNIPGTGNTAAGSVTAGAFSQSVNDLDSAVIVVLADPSDIGAPPFTVTFNICSGASVSAADFSCLVEQAGDVATTQSTYGVTCSVTVN